MIHKRIDSDTRYYRMLKTEESQRRRHRNDPSWSLLHRLDSILDWGMMERRHGVRRREIT